MGPSESSGVRGGEPSGLRTCGLQWECPDSNLGNGDGRGVEGPALSHCPEPCGNFHCNTTQFALWISLEKAQYGVVVVRVYKRKDLQQDT